MYASKRLLFFMSIFLIIQKNDAMTVSRVRNVGQIRNRLEVCLEEEKKNEKKVVQFLNNWGESLFVEASNQLYEQSKYIQNKIIARASEDQQLFLRVLMLSADMRNKIFDTLCDNDKQMKQWLCEKKMGYGFEWHALMQEKYKRDNILRGLIPLYTLITMKQDTVIGLYDTTHYFKNNNMPYIILANCAEALRLLPDEIKESGYFNNKEFDVQDTWAQAGMRLSQDCFFGTMAVFLSIMPYCVIKKSDDFGLIRMAQIGLQSIIVSTSALPMLYSSCTHRKDKEEWEKQNLVNGFFVMLSIVGGASLIGKTPDYVDDVEALECSKFLIPLLSFIRIIHRWIQYAVTPKHKFLYKQITDL